jgi:hypothetical protein
MMLVFFPYPQPRGKKKRKENCSKGTILPINSRLYQLDPSPIQIFINQPPILI